MDDLQPNPEGCQGFLPNPFKKERCKHCGCTWELHKGVISQADLNSFLEARRKVAEAKAKAEAEAKAKAKAKKEALKKKDQAVEDDWLMDGGEQHQAGAEDSESDDDMGFQMFAPENFNASRPSAAPAAESKPLKVRNLIDFSECDVAEEQAGGTSSLPLSSSAAVEKLGSASGPPISQASSAPFRMDFSVSPMVPSSSSTASAAVPARQSADAEELEMEVQHLRQMLAQANEVKAIEIDIIRDEVKEKQAKVDELASKLKVVEGELLSSQTRVKDLEQAADLEGKADKQEHVDELTAKLARVEADLASAQNRVVHLESKVVAKLLFNDANLQADKHKLMDDLADKVAKLAAIEADLASSQSRVLELESRIQAQPSEPPSEPISIAEAEADKQKLLDDLTAKLTTVQAELLSSQNRVQELESSRERPPEQQKETSNADTAADQDKQKLVDELTAKLAAVEADLVSSRNHVQELESRVQAQPVEEIPEQQRPPSDTDVKAIEQPAQRDESQDKLIQVEEQLSRYQKRVVELEGMVAAKVNLVAPEPSLEIDVEVEHLNSDPAIVASDAAVDTSRIREATDRMDLAFLARMLTAAQVEHLNSDPAIVAADAAVDTSRLREATDRMDLAFLARMLTAAQVDVMEPAALAPSIDADSEGKDHKEETEVEHANNEVVPTTFPAFDISRIRLVTDAIDATFLEKAMTASAQTRSEVPALREEEEMLKAKVSQLEEDLSKSHAQVLEMETQAKATELQPARTHTSDDCAAAQAVREMRLKFQNQLGHLIAQHQERVSLQAVIA